MINPEPLLALISPATQQLITKSSVCIILVLTVFTAATVNNVIKKENVRQDQTSTNDIIITMPRPKHT